KLPSIEAKFEGNGQIVLRLGRDHGEPPPLQLQRGGNPESGAKPVVAPHPTIGQAPPTGIELPAGLHMPKGELEPISFVKPIIEPCLRSLAVASNPASQQHAIAGVAVMEASIGIKKTASNCAASRNIRVNAFQTQVQPRQVRQPRQIQTSTNGRAVPVGDRRELVIGKSISVKRHPVAQQRQTIGPIQTGAPVAGISRGARQGVSRTQNTADNATERKGHAGATHHSRAGETELKVRRGFEAESLAVNPRLGLKRLKKTTSGPEVSPNYEEVASQVAEEHLRAHRTKKSGQQWKRSGRNA